ncbi:MAG: Fe-S oxidoreductase [Candidatus Methanolliviera sp. GoM_oil]|nr:MAG: Fe-S oxidoreductase [Candidatus Methanolliviera sp. GoM_oil]
MKDEYDFFDRERCDLCGECLENCQYMDFTHDEAVEEMKNLIAGKESKVYDGCISCYACNTFCPNDCHPYELILKGWYDRYRKKGLPVRARWLMPLPYPPENFRSYLVPKMPEDERALLRKWEAQSKSLDHEEMFYTGCNLLALPYLADTKIFRDLPIFGRWDLCCGEMYFRGGVYAPVKEQARKLTEYFAGSKIKRLYFICPAGLNMFKNVLPKQFGAEFDFECEYIGDWILDRMKSGKIKVEKKLDIDATVHDSCQTRVLGSSVMDTNRELLERMGVNVVEMEHNREKGYCCGCAAGLNDHRLSDMALTSIKAMKEMKATGASEAAIFCTGCYVTFGGFDVLYPTGQPKRHIMEYIKDACGEGFDSRIKERGRNVALGIVRSLPKLLSGERYWVEEIK